jgi:hypothetical protein
MLVGPAADKARSRPSRQAQADPDDFIAQPTLALSTCPTFVGSGVAPRHVDLRPFVLTGADKVRIVPGGLTRVALKEGSLVVNSSQGGGTKDTGCWGAPGALQPNPLPGSMGPTHALAHRRQPLLARALCRARRISRPHPRGHAAAAALPPPMSARATNGNRRSPPPAARDSSTSTTTRQRGQPSSTSSPSRPTTRPPSATASSRPHQCPRRAHRADHGDVGRDQRRLARTQALRRAARMDARSSIAQFLRWVQEPRCASTARPTGPCCATTPTGSRASASTSSAPTTPRASST